MYNARRPNYPILYICTKPPRTCLIDIFAHMQLEVEAIKTAFETLGLSPEAIAEERQMDIVSVKAALMSSSSKYRKMMGASEEKPNELDFTDEELKEANEIIVNTAKYATNADGSPDYRTRLAAATYIRAGRS